MAFSYSDACNFVIYNKDSSTSYLDPQAKNIPVKHNCFIIQPSTKRLYSYTYSTTGSTISLISGNTFHTTDEITSTILDEYNIDSLNNFCYNAICFDNDENADTGKTRYPAGKGSFRAGRLLYTCNPYETTLGYANVTGNITYDYDDNKINDDYVTFSIGNGYIKGSTLYRSNIITASKNRFIVSGDTYIGWSLSGDYNNKYYQCKYTYNGTSPKSLYVNGNIYTSELYIADNKYPVIHAENFIPEMLNGTSSGNGGTLYSPVTKEEWQDRLNQLRSKCTIDWLDFYEMMFRDTIVFFKGIIANASGIEWTVTNRSHNQDWERARNFYVQTGCLLDTKYNQNPNSGWYIKDLGPYWVKSTWAEGRPGKFQIKIQIEWDSDDQEDSTSTRWIRPSKDAYDIVAAVAGDIAYWFSERELYNSNGKVINGRWSPMTQYQDTDTNADGSSKTILQKTYRPQHQIYYNISDQKYYRVDPVTLDLVEIWTDATAATTVTSTVTGTTTSTVTGTTTPTVTGTLQTSL